MIQPIGNRIMIKQLERESKSIIVIDESKEDRMLPQGEVKAISNSNEVKESGIKVGDKIYFNQYGGERIKVESEEFVILNISEVLAIC